MIGRDGVVLIMPVTLFIKLIGKLVLAAKQLFVIGLFICFLSIDIASFTFVSNVFELFQLLLKNDVEYGKKFSYAFRSNIFKHL